MQQIAFEIPDAGVSPANDLAGNGYECMVCGREHARMTQMLDATCPKYALVPWAENVGRDAAHAIYKDTGGLPADKAALKELIKQRGLDAESQKLRGGNRGTAVHDFLAAYIATGEVAPLSDLDPEHRPYGQSLAQFLIDYEPQFLASEFYVVHHALDYAGRCDGIAVIGNQPPRRNKPYDLTGKTVLFDLKSNKEGRVYPPAHLYQVAGYELALQQMKGEESVTDFQVVVAVGDGGGSPTTSWRSATSPRPTSPPWPSSTRLNNRPRAATQMPASPSPPLDGDE